jgi:hypothetical protein
LAGYSADFFNTGFKVLVITSTNSISTTTAWDITDYTAAGTFTTESVGANWTAGDWVDIVTDAEAVERLMGTSGLVGPGAGSTEGSVASGLITAYTSGTSFTVATVADLSTTLFSVTAGGQPNYVIRVDQVDETADSSLLKIWAPLFTLSSAGVLTVSPTILGADQAAVLDVGDFVSIVPIEYINPPNACRWIERATTGGSGSVTLSGLIGRPSTFIPTNAQIKCINDASAATNDGLVSYVTSFTSATGAVTFSPVHTAAVQDQYLIEWGAAVEYAYGSAVASGAPKAIQSTLSSVNAGTQTLPNTTVSGGTDVTGAAVGAVYIESIGLQCTGASEGAGIAGIWLISNETVPLNQILRKRNGDPITSADLLQGVRFEIPINHLLATTKKLSIVPIGAAGAAGAASWVIDIIYRANAGAATLAGV